MEQVRCTDRPSAVGSFPRPVCTALTLADLPPVSGGEALGVAGRGGAGRGRDGLRELRWSPSPIVPGCPARCSSRTDQTEQRNAPRVRIAPHRRALPSDPNLTCKVAGQGRAARPAPAFGHRRHFCHFGLPNAEHTSLAPAATPHFRQLDAP